MLNPNNNNQVNFVGVSIIISKSSQLYSTQWYLLQQSNYIKRLCPSLCLSVCMSRSLLSRIKSVWKAGGTVRTVSAMACYIPTFKKFHARVHAISRNFHAIFTQFWLFQPFLGQFQHVGYQNACTRAEKFIGNTFTQFHTPLHAIFTQFGLFQPFLGQFQHVGYQKASTRAEKFIGGIGRGHRPQVGAEGPKKRPKASKWGQRPPTALGRS